MKTFILFIFILGLSFATAADDTDAPEIETLMAPEDFSASGLDKLTDAEREHLSGWVARYREGAIKGPPVPGKQRKEAAAAAAVAQETTQAALPATAQETTQETTQETALTTTDEYPEEYQTRKQKEK